MKYRSLKQYNEAQRARNLQVVETRIRRLERQSTSDLSVLDLIKDPAWLFTSDTWDEWKGFLAALFALPPTEEQRNIYKEFAKRTDWPEKPCREAWMIVGRRGGKSRIAALVATYLACYRDYSRYLAAGEQAMIPIISKNMREAFVILRYIKGFINTVPEIRTKVTRKPSGRSVELNGVTIEVMANSFRSVRGFTVVNALCDEIAYWHSDETSVNPDTEVLRALRPAMLTIPNALLLGLSSPYGQKGVLWDAFDQHYGKEGDRVLVWKGSTEAMNPSVDGDEIRQAFELDDIAARAEYGAEFRCDVAGYVHAESLDAVVVKDRKELAPIPKRLYWAFVDVSGGAQDSFTLAVGYKNAEGIMVQVLIREWRAPFDTTRVTEECAAILKAYGCYNVHGDKYGGEWPRAEFRKHGITYLTADKPKNDYYVELLGYINGKKVELLDNKRQRNQILGLERKVGRSGKDSIDHPPGGHDDVANALAGLSAYVMAGPVLTTVDLNTAEGLEDKLENAHPYDKQMKGTRPELFERPFGRALCGSCVYYRKARIARNGQLSPLDLEAGGWCAHIEQNVTVKTPQCADYKPM